MAMLIETAINKRGHDDDMQFIKTNEDRDNDNKDEVKAESVASL